MRLSLAPDAAAACRSLGLVWLAIGCQPFAAALLGAGPASFGCFALATLGALLPRPRPAAPCPGSWLGGVAAFGAAAAAGSTACALSTLADAVPPAGDDIWATAAALLLAPVFEEVLYRGRLFSVLHARRGAPTALLATSALFALPHAEPGAVLFGFGAGLALGTARLAKLSLAVCVGLHAGWNLGITLATRG